ncbi:CU044_5270 family protein [Microbispora sp. NPDC049125]|uniref:CU044_5270 family protein n=1 Tax=Microbispora sp. NPDC049125 TaxID=3154929 RepID=UPI003465152C
MNPMDQLRAARPAHLDTPVDERVRAAELSHAMSQARPVRRRRIPARAWGVGLAGAAAATAVTVAVTATGGAAPAPGAPTAAAPSAPSASGGTQVVRLSAKQVLLVAAESSLKAKAGSGAYWYVESRSGNAQQVGTKVRYTVNSLDRSEMWISRLPETDSWWISQNLGTGPAPGSEAAWKQDGSPTRWTVPAGKKGYSGKLMIEAKAGKPFGNPINVGDKVFDLAGRNVSVAELQALPTTPAALKTRLLQGYAGHGTESGEKMDADSWLYQVTSGLLSDMPVKPAVRAAAYQVLAGLDGVRSLGEVTDALGRTGQGIGRAEHWSNGQYERQLIVDPRTGVLLTDQIVAVHAGGQWAGAKPGTVVNWKSITKAEWTDREPVTP